MPNTRVEFRVSGRVQGVGYRYFCLEVAGRLGVMGYARNLRDGSVQVVAEASDELLAELEQALREGPPMSQVDDIQRRVVDGMAETFDGFEIRR